MTPAQLTVVAERWLGWRETASKSCTNIAHNRWGYMTSSGESDYGCSTCRTPLPDMYSDETFGKLVLALWANDRERLALLLLDNCDSEREAKKRVVKLACDLATKEQRET